MVRAIIIDDELQSRKTLKALINRYTDDIDIVCDADSVANGVAAIKEANPQLVFLDISMPDGDGFDVLDKCNYENFEVIFTTAYDEYTIKALRVQAVDYLLKPINISELQNAVNSAVNKIMHNLQYVNNVDNNSVLLLQKKIAIPAAKGVSFIDLNDIIYLAANGSYTNIVCVNDINILSSKPMKEYENILPSKIYFRTHHSYIVNLNYVKQFHREDGNYILMDNNFEVALSRRKKQDFFALFRL